MIFSDCTKSAQVRIIKIKFLSIIVKVFQYSNRVVAKRQKRRPPNTVKYFQEHRRKGYSKTK